MLLVRNLRKVYQAGALVQTALDDVSVGFRDQEFVAILGPSGSGKTTLLNMIGGLDHYDSGDLMINGISTKDYKDKDWDSYRNHTVGFIFQAYNLIGHQTILSNVELALTICNMNRQERKKRALEALDKVGLKAHAHKLPSQLSGGQMQRVAIARALVNNPSVILADEPTGALDSKTSIQVMDLLKEVAKERLVIMVTHNPELAEAYASRIVHLKDGKIISDSNPLKETEMKQGTPIKQPTRLKFSTALHLSLNNLKTKKGRTILTAFAGAIGIIGIALILSLSNGVNAYIRGVESQMLGNYPIRLESKTYDLNKMMDTGYSINLNQIQAITEVDENKINSQPLVGDVVSSTQGVMIENDLASFKTYLDSHGKTIQESLYAVEYEYPLEPYIYRRDPKVGLIKVSPAFLSPNENAAMGPMLSSVWSKLPKSQTLMENQYTLLAGSFPKEANEVALILSSHHQVSDFTLYTIGLMDYSQMEQLIDARKNGKAFNDTVEKFRYEDALGLSFKAFGPGQLYKKSEDIYIDKSEDKAFVDELYDQGMDLKITCVLEAKEDASIASGVGYTQALIESLMVINNDSEAVKAQVFNPQINILTGKNFEVERQEKQRLGLMSTTDTYRITLKNADGTIISQYDYQKGEAISQLPEKTPILPPTTKTQYIFIGWTSSQGDYYTTATLPIVSQDETYTATYLEVPLDPSLLDLEKMKEYLNQLIQGEIDITDILSDEQIQAIIQEMISAMPDMDISAILDKEKLDALIKDYIGQIDITDYLTDEQIQEIFTFYLENYADKIDMESYMKAYIDAYFNEFINDPSQMQAYMETYMQSYLDQMMATAFANLSQEQIDTIMARYSSSTPSTYEEVLETLGYVDLKRPVTMNLYPVDFENKAVVEDFIQTYNDQVEDPEMKVTYNDMIAALTKGMTDIIDTISYILIAFVAISLIVSSIMIAIITYISVLERNKEIGVLRAIGASKGDVSKIFNAETFIEGFLSGILGIITTLILTVPINKIVYQLTNVDHIAKLPWQAAGILIVISIVLTLIAGFIPSRMASKKDPVKALRGD